MEGLPLIRFEGAGVDVQVLSHTVTDFRAQQAIYPLPFSLRAYRPERAATSGPSSGRGTAPPHLAAEIHFSCGPHLLCVFEHWLYFTAEHLCQKTPSFTHPWQTPMAYTGRSSRTEGDGSRELFRKEKAKRDSVRGLLPSTEERPSSQRSIPNPTTREGLTWLKTPFRVHDPLGVQRVLASALEKRYLIEWVPRAKRGKRLKAIWWRKRTPAAVAEAKILVRAGEYSSFSEAIGLICGTSLSQELERAARDLGLSVTTLRRLVRGEATSLSWIFAERLRKKLRPAEWSQLEKVLLSPVARKVRDEYVAYIDREIDRLQAGRSEAHDVYITNEERRHRTSFERAAKSLGAPATRAPLAVLRVYDGFVGWSGLQEWLATYSRGATRKQLVSAAFRRERLLLRTEMRLFRQAAAGRLRNPTRT